MKSSNPEIRKFIQSLTLEYVHQNNLMSCRADQIPSQLEKIKEISNIISNSIIPCADDFDMFE